MNRLIETFIELVKIDSPSGEEDAVRNFVIRYLKDLDIKSSVDKTGNLFARVDGVGEPVLLSCHLDTVEPGRGIKPVISKGVIKSDGTTILGADNKIAVAVILETLREIHDRMHLPLELVFSVREETDGGINLFDFSKLKSKYGLVADRASKIGSIVTKSPWITNFEIIIEGKPAHAGTPENGINALSATVRAITQLKLGRVDKFTTVNIGLINGGSAMNSIPGEVRLEGEVRSFDKVFFDRAIKSFEMAFRSVGTQKGLKINIHKNLYCSGYVYRNDDDAVTQIADTFKKLKVNAVYETSFGASDANAFVANGIKVVNIGDGGLDPHTTKESVSIKNLERLQEFFVTFVSRD